MKRLWTGAAIGAAGLALAGCGSSASPGGWTETTGNDHSASSLTDQAAINESIADALSGGDPVECEYREKELAGTFQLGPGDVFRMDLDQGLSTVYQDSAVQVWTRQDGAGLVLSPGFALELGIPDMTTPEGIESEGLETDRCRRLAADEAPDSPPSEIRFTAVESEGDLMTWLADSYDNQSSSAMLDLMIDDDASEQGQGLFYLGLGTLMTLPEAEIQRYGALSESEQERYWMERNAGMTPRQQRANLDEALNRLRPEHRRLAEQVVD